MRDITDTMVLENNVSLGEHFKYKLPIDNNFIEWFVGFSEAESNFLCRLRVKEQGQGLLGYEFLFRISLHKDDIRALEYIKSNLGCGTLYHERNVVTLRISKLGDIENILIPLFDKFPLNTTKHLDYLSFKKAFFT
jgi:hypothetical protein